MKTRSEEHEDRRQLRTRRIISMIMILLMVFSVFAGYTLFVTGGSTTIHYNGHSIKTVTDQNGFIQGYFTKVNGKSVSFYTQPEDSLSIPLPPGFIEALKTTPGIVFLFDPTDNQTAIYDQLRFDFSQTLAAQQGAGVTKPTNAYSFPLLTCANATGQYLFILLANGNRSITYTDGCFALTGTSYDYPLIRDRVLYAYYDITKN